MQTSDAVALAAVVISGLSFAYSVLNNIRQNKYIKTQHELNNLLVSREKKELVRESTAEVSANLVSLGKNSHKIRVFNKGKSDAINVRFELETDPGWMMVDEIFPVEILGSGLSVDVRVFLHAASERKATCKLSWTDTSGSHERTTILTV